MLLVLSQRYDFFDAAYDLMTVRIRCQVHLIQLWYLAFAGNRRNQELDS